MCVLQISQIDYNDDSDIKNNFKSYLLYFLNFVKKNSSLKIFSSCKIKDIKRWSQKTNDQR